MYDTIRGRVFEVGASATVEEIADSLLSFFDKEFGEEFQTDARVGQAWTELVYDLRKAAQKFRKEIR